MRTSFLTPFLVALSAALLSCGGRGGPQVGAAPSPLVAGILRASQAPIVGLRDVLTVDSLVGKRVRVLGWCYAAPGLLAGRRIGAWILATPDTMIEVRGLVSPTCAPHLVRQTMVLLFAQVVPAEPESPDRLLLRLPE